jgi:hypothetical protein
MEKTNKANREYNFTDAHLIKLTASVLILIDRDGTPLARRGITPAWLAMLIAIRNAFAATKPDHYFRAMVSVRTEEKNALRVLLTSDMRMLLIAAENVADTCPAVYISFGNTGFTRQKDDELIRNSRIVVNTARENLADLADEGITEELLDQTDALIEDFDRTRYALLKAKHNRDKAAKDRVRKGNALYNALVKVCKKGKDIWGETDESNYRDYVIYNTPDGKPAAKNQAA